MFRHTSFITEDSHYQMMATLNAKLVEKQRLAKELEQLQEKKRQLKESVASDSKRLTALDAKLKVVAKNASLFQQYIQITPHKQIKPSNNLSQLPAPLFLIYKQALGYAEFFDNDVEVIINGDISDAISQQTTLTTPYPLSVTVIFPSKFYFSVKFVYYPNIRLVTASTEHSGILNNLFPNDTGRTFPSVSCDYTTTETGKGLEVEQLEGLPYKWAQAISHLEHLSTSLVSTPNVSTSNLSTSNSSVDFEDDTSNYTFHNVVKRIKSSIGS